MKVKFKSIPIKDEEMTPSEKVMYLQGYIACKLGLKEDKVLEEAVEIISSSDLN